MTGGAISPPAVRASLLYGKSAGLVNGSLRIKTGTKLEITNQKYPKEIHKNLGRKLLTSKLGMIK